MPDNLQWGEKEEKNASDFLVMPSHEKCNWGGAFLDDVLRKSFEPYASSRIKVCQEKKGICDEYSFDFVLHFLYLHTGKFVVIIIFYDGLHSLNK